MSRRSRLQTEQGCDLGHSVGGVLHTVADHTRMGINLVVIATSEGFVAEEMNFVELAIVNVIQAVGLVPALRKHVERYLAANGELQLQMSKFVLHRLDHVLANVVGQVEHFISITLLLAAVTTNRRDVEHTRAKLHESSSLNRNVQVSDVPQGKIDNCLNIIFSQECVDSLFTNQFSILIGNKAILRKAIINLANNVIAELLFLFHQI
mmetsp:Transcript_2955/g.4933  ORF Transcript_2955/g.4933 Transcript_2955/m.4933 type:complete len:208 (-) Transcript_2955:13-636(-)